MERYSNLNGNSDVIAFEVGQNSITVQFSDGMKYQYTAASAGAGAVATMQQLAKAGRGLNAYININVRKLYSRKFR